MIILKYQLLEFTDLKKYQAKVRDELKNSDTLELRIITIP